MFFFGGESVGRRVLIEKKRTRQDQGRKVKEVFGSFCFGAIMASGDVARCRHLCAALLLLSVVLLVPAESSMKSVEQLVVRVLSSLVNVLT